MKRAAKPRKQVVDLPPPANKRKRGRPGRKLKDTGRKTPSPSPIPEQEEEESAIREGEDELAVATSPPGVQSDLEKDQRPSTPSGAGTSPARSAHRSDTESSEDDDSESADSAEDTVQLKRRRTAEMQAILGSRTKPRRLEQDIVVRGVTQRDDWLRPMQPAPGPDYKRREIDLDDMPWAFDTSVRLTYAHIADCSSGTGTRKRRRCLATLTSSG